MNATGCQPPATPSALRTRVTIGLVLLLPCLLYTLLLLREPEVLGLRLRLMITRQVLIWPRPAWTVAAAFLAPVLVLAAILAIRRGQRERSPASPVGRWLYVLTPLGTLPLAFLPHFLGRLVPASLAANVLFYVPALACSVVLYRLVITCGARFSARPISGRDILVMVLGASLFYALVGWHFTTAAGEHAGDEGHYLMQVRSLREDGDLDLRNNLGFPPESERAWHHISPASRRGHWYSLHPVGLPLLLAPVDGAGVWARHVVLGLISGLACGGMLYLCAAFGASRAAAWLLTLLLALSTFWGVYSSRALPEVLGATLTVWLVAAAFMQRRYPWPSVLLAVVCAGYLPWAHTRFVPLSLLGAAWYAWEGWRHAPRKAVLVGRLAVLGTLCLVAYAVYLVVQNQMFSGGNSYAVRNLLLSRPIGLWHTLASSRGILYSLPMFAWLLPAALLTAARDREARPLAVWVLGFLATVLVTSSATVLFTAGTCLPGRFLVVVAPLMVVPAARLFDRASPLARGWLIFLGIVSLLLFAVELPQLARLGKGFAFPWERLPVILPWFEGWLCPLTDPYVESLHAFGLLLYVATLGVLVVPRRRWQVGMLLAVAVGAVLSHAGRVGSVPRADPARNADLLARVDFRRARLRAWPDGPPVPLWSVSDMFAGGRRPVFGVTTADLGAPGRGTMLSQPRLPNNDWAGRPLQWATLVTPFSAGRGRRLFALTGTVEGSVTPWLAVREGSRTLREEPLAVRADGRVAVTWSLECNGAGWIYVLLRLEGAHGTFRPVSIHWSPADERLLSACRLQVPREACPD